MYGNFDITVPIEKMPYETYEQQEKHTYVCFFKQKNIVDASVFRLNKNNISEQFLISKQIFNYRNENEDIEHNKKKDVYNYAARGINMRKLCLPNAEMASILFGLGVHKLRNGFHILISF